MTLETTDAEVFDTDLIEAMERDLMAISDAIAARYFGWAPPVSGDVEVE